VLGWFVVREDDEQQNETTEEPEEKVGQGRLLSGSSSLI
jgi:hypothetical protein